MADRRVGIVGVINASHVETIDGQQVEVIDSFTVQGVSTNIARPLLLPQMLIKSMEQIAFSGNSGDPREQKPK